MKRCTWVYQDRLQKETEYLGVLYLVVYPGIESVARGSTKIDYKRIEYLRVLYSGIRSAASGYTQEDYKGVEYLWVPYSSIILATCGHTQTTHK